MPTTGRRCGRDCCRTRTGYRTRYRTGFRTRYRTGFRTGLHHDRRPRLRRLHVAREEAGVEREPVVRDPHAVTNAVRLARGVDGPRKPSWLGRAGFGQGSTR